MTSSRKAGMSFKATEARILALLTMQPQSTASVLSTLKIGRIAFTAGFTSLRSKGLVVAFPKQRSTGGRPCQFWGAASILPPYKGAAA